MTDNGTGSDYNTRMSWRDRDYASNPGYGDTWTTGPSIRSGLRGWLSRSVVNKLLAINAAIYLLCVFTGGLSSSPLYRWGVLIDDEVLRRFQLWRIITAMFLHADVWHIVLNMFGLYMFGQPVEQRWGPRRTLGVYMVSGLLGNLTYLLLSAIGYFERGSLLGASGAVLAMMGAAAVLFPHMKVYVFYGMLAAPIRVLAGILAVVFFLNAYQRGANAGGDVCHLVGLVAGAGWAWKGRVGIGGKSRWFEGIRRRVPASRGSGHPASPAGWRGNQRDEDQAELDGLLRIVGEKGLTGLSEAQRRRLNEISDRMRGDYGD